MKVGARGGCLRVVGAPTEFKFEFFRSNLTQI